jgi:predicted nucleic acid-binding protein
VRSFYLDASALGKRYAPEAGSANLDHLFGNVSPDRIALFNVGIAEVVSILVRKKNGGRISPATLAGALVDLGSEIIHSTGIRKVVADDALVTVALPLIEAYSVNSTDAIVLRSALDLAASLRPAGNDMVLVASDKRLLKAAQAEGLLTFDPETQTQAELDALIGP